MTGVQRLSGHAFATTVNMERPSMEDLKEISHYIGNSSYVWTDGLQGYSSLLEEKDCTHKILESKESYDSVNHLNNVNSFHSRIQKQYTEYRGVATKYINRYNALFVLQHEYRGMDSQEYLLLILGRLRKMCHKFFIRQINKEELFLGCEFI